MTISHLSNLCETYTEVLQVVDGDLVAEKVDQSILEHASVAVSADMLARPFSVLKRPYLVEIKRRSNAEMQLKPQLRNA